MISEILLKVGATILDKTWNPFEPVNKHRQLRKEFQVLLLRIKHCQVDHLINVELGAIREFFFANSLLGRPDVDDFYGKWIEPRAGLIGRPVSTGWTKAEFDTMLADLEKIKL